MDISQVSDMQLEQLLIDKCEDMQTSGLEWAKAQTIADQLENLKKPVLYSNMPSDGSEAAKERVAYSCEAYKNHLEALSIASGRALSAQVQYKASQAKVDALRTLISTRRERVKRGIDA